MGTWRLARLPHWVSPASALRYAHNNDSSSNDNSSNDHISISRHIDRTVCVPVAFSFRSGLVLMVHFTAEYNILPGQHGGMYEGAESSGMNASTVNDRKSSSAFITTLPSLYVGGRTCLICVHVVARGAKPA